MIRPAKKTEIDEILQLTAACAKHLISKGIYQWNEHYPSRTAFESDWADQSLYILKPEDTLVGTVVLSDHRDAEYDPINWLTPLQSHCLYVHRLAVHPNFQGQGYAQQLMDFAEHKAKTEGYVSVRLDTFSQNSRNVKFYEQRGYTRLDDVYFPKQSEFPFHCYELVF
ncbi:GNAT family N-acetyltransferase [Flavobacteriaceae bacterium YJPT1-3]|nr:GNAT family N-acetyltransferase [Flavobacteriaceae bacterium YJPT1-3]